ncbi:sec24-related protein [Anaeramoeba ignava]|uniref:Sec24-related protein n=1 Tax=Anaeramoeba ignava TaxID=1746090 RepID=A0A9Q0LB99_ANAIG|nr:sec24-related protein [Anaeramoeba ignava]
MNQQNSIFPNQNILNETNLQFVGTQPKPQNQEIKQFQFSTENKNIEIKDCSEEYISLTTNLVPQSQSTIEQSKIPFGLTVTPFAEKKENNLLPPVPTVQFLNFSVPRCKSCHGYINPYVKFTNNGNNWICNICNVINITPKQYYSPLDKGGLRADIDKREELVNPVVEFSVGKEYCSHIPLPPGYFFVINVSKFSIASGFLQTAVQSIKYVLENELLHGSKTKRVGIMTFNSSLHFYNLNPKLSEPQMVVLPDIDDIFPPSLNDFFVPLVDSYSLFINLLDRLPTIFKDSSDSESALSSALQTAFKLMSSYGGKMIVFQHGLPTLTSHKLANRAAQKIMNLELLLKPADETAFYQNFAISCVRQQISIYLFLFSNGYSDVSTLKIITDNTAGKLYYYNNYHDQNILQKNQFYHQLKNILTIYTSWEAVLRTRFSTGLSISKFYGNFYLTSTDLLQLPNLTQQDTFAFDLKLDASLFRSKIIYLQSAILYSNSNRQRTIRVINSRKNFAQSIQELFDSVNIDTLMNILLKRSIYLVPRVEIKKIKDVLINSCAQIIKSWKLLSNPNFQINPTNTPVQSSEISLPNSLQLFPLLIFGVYKSGILNWGSVINPDEMAFQLHLMNNASNTQVSAYIYPHLYPIHNLPSNCGILKEGIIEFPQRISLSFQNFSTNGIYLLTNGVFIYIWIGNNANEQEINELFSKEENSRNQNEIYLKKLENDYNKRIWTLIVELERIFENHLPIKIITENNSIELQRYLIEDKSHDLLSYSEFYHHLIHQSNF